MEGIKERRMKWKESSKRGESSGRNQREENEEEGIK